VEKMKILTKERGAASRFSPAVELYCCKLYSIFLFKNTNKNMIPEILNLLTCDIQSPLELAESL
jgi:hypothetical protein